MSEPAQARHPADRVPSIATKLGVGLVVGFVTFFLIIVWVWHRPRGLPPADPAQLVFQDDFERAEVGPAYRQGEADQGWKAGEWKIEQGRLQAKDIHNAGLWLKQPLPEQVRIDLTVRAETKAGDVKCEVFGDGENHQSGYILIYGGWNNTVNCIARQDEHGEDRKTDNRERVVPGVDYEWTVIRTDDTVEWYIDGRLLLTFPDRHPVRGRHFAFNNWEAHGTFDNLRIYDLSK